MAVTDSVLLADAAATPLPRSPRAHITSDPIPTDSMVSVSLTDSDPHTSLTSAAGGDVDVVNDMHHQSISSRISSKISSRISNSSSNSSSNFNNTTNNVNGNTDELDFSSAGESDDTAVASQPLHDRSRSSVDIMHGLDLDTELNGPRLSISSQPGSEANRSVAHLSVSTVQGDDAASADPTTTSDRTGSVTSNESSEDSDDQVDWSELDKTEESEPRNEESDEANQMLASDQKFGGLNRNRSRKQSRPPSISVLRKLVKDPQRSSCRLSELPEPPPLTELEFWAALVKDYQQTAQRLPTLTANKIRGGVPPPIRGLVWISMVDARDRDLADLFDRLVLEPSPWDSNIAKDVGRSFPLVDMFKDPGGRGQQMLSRVLKAFSLYDEEIGYCQGLGFLVGPLLMQMDDRDAFVVLVRLMDNFGLRSCFMPDLSGLHLRIFQFQRLLEQHMPELSAHLKGLQLEAAFLSQWFLSFFAVTCPLDMLFRIYDVIFAEGASETIMRVALALMRRNEDKLRGSDEFDDCMKLLLQPALWDVYAGNADAMVDDFMSMTAVVTRDTLARLEHAFRNGEAKKEAARPLAFADVTAAASSFIGRLWTAAPTTATATATTATTTSTNSLSPGSGGPFSALRRSASKQSLASTVHSATDAGSSGSENSTNSVGTVTTSVTDTSRNSSADVMSIRSKTESLAPSRHAKDRDLHMQIEDLLAALGEMQRDTALLSAQLQKEREERDEDKRLLRDLNEHVKNESDTPSAAVKRDRRQTLAAAPAVELSPASQALSDRLRDIVERVDDRLAVQDNLRRSSMLETKQQLRESLARHKEQLAGERARSAELSRQIDLKEREAAGVREELREARLRLQHDFADRQKLERTVSELRSAHSSAAYSDDCYSPFSPTGADVTFATRPPSGSSGSPGGLRELKLGKRDSRLPTSSYHPPRGSSLATKEILATVNHAPPADEAMLLELVNAKTAEAEARQEADELRGRLETMRKQLAASQAASAPSLVSSWAGAWGSSTAKTPSPSAVTVTTDSTVLAPLQTSAGVREQSTEPKSAVTPPVSAVAATAAATASNATPAAGGFWSWGKRSISTASVPSAAVLGTAASPGSGGC